MKKKICMIGHFGVGKTSLVRRFVESDFDEKYFVTVGVKVDKKEVILDGQPVLLMLWDLAGEDELAQVNLSHLRGAFGYILVVDGCRLVTFQKAVELQQRIKTVVGDLPFVVALNKSDLKDKWEVSPDGARGSGWTVFETSAKLGAGVEEMFLELASKV